MWDSATIDGFATASSLVCVFFYELNSSRTLAQIATIPCLFPWIIDLPLPALEAVNRTRFMTHVRLSYSLRSKLIRLQRLGREMLAREKSAENNNIIRSLRQQNGTEVTDKMLDHITTLLFAAQEEIPMTTRNILWQLARNQRVQDALHEEVMTFEGTPTYDDLTGTKLPWLDAIFKET